MTTLFISDLHLEESRPDITGAFLTFLRDKALGVERLYILGDFFEAWIGDDERTPLQEQVAAALREGREGVAWWEDDSVVCWEPSSGATLQTGETETESE